MSQQSNVNNQYFNLIHAILTWNGGVNASIYENCGEWWMNIDGEGAVGGK